MFAYGFSRSLTFQLARYFTLHCGRCNASVDIIYIYIIRAKVGWRVMGFGSPCYAIGRLRLRRLSPQCLCHNFGVRNKVLSHLFVQLRRSQHDDGEGRKVEESVNFPFTALNILSVVHTSCHGQAPSTYDCISNHRSKRFGYSCSMCAKHNCCKAIPFHSYHLFPSYRIKAGSSSHPKFHISPWYAIGSVIKSINSVYNHINNTNTAASLITSSILLCRLKKSQRNTEDLPLTRKRNRPSKTPSPLSPPPPPDPTRRPHRQRITSPPVRNLKLPSTKPPPQNRPAPRQYATHDAPKYTARPTSSIQGGQEGGLSGAGLGYGVTKSRDSTPVVFVSVQPLMPPLTCPLS